MKTALVIFGSALVLGALGLAFLSWLAAGMADRALHMWDDLWKPLAYCAVGGIVGAVMVWWGLRD